MLIGPYFTGSISTLPDDPLLGLCSTSCIVFSFLLVCLLHEGLMMRHTDHMTDGSTFIVFNTLAVLLLVGSLTRWCCIIGNEARLLITER